MKKVIYIGSSAPAFSAEKSALFDAVDEISVCTDAGVLNVWENASWSMLVWARCGYGLYQNLIDKTTVSIVAAQPCIRFTTNPPHTFRLDVDNNNGSRQIRVLSTVLHTPNRWNLFGCTYDGSSKAAGTLLYMDGVDAGHSVSTDGLTGYQVRPDGPLTVGAVFWPVNPFWGVKGAICQAAVWMGTVLTPAQMLEAYNNGVPMDWKNLAVAPTGFWTFGDKAGDSTAAGGLIQDISGNGYDLTSTNQEAEDIISENPQALSPGVYFDYGGTNEYTDMGNVANETSAADFSISLKFICPAAGDKYFISKGGSTNGFYVGAESNKLVFWMKDAEGDVLMVRTPDLTFRDGAVHNIIFAFDSSTRKVAQLLCWFDGVAQSLTTVADNLDTSSNTGNSTSFYIARTGTSYQVFGCYELIKVPFKLTSGQATTIYASNVKCELDKTSMWSTTKGNTRSMWLNFVFDSTTAASGVVDMAMARAGTCYNMEAEDKKTI